LSVSGANHWEITYYIWNEMWWESKFNCSRSSSSAAALNWPVTLKLKKRSMKNTYFFKKNKLNLVQPPKSRKKAINSKSKMGNFDTWFRI